MKTYLFKFVLLSLVLIVFSCSEDDDNQTGQLSSEIENSITSGTWRISYYFDSGTDETAHFTGYNFTFGDNGTLSASDGINTYSGTWSISKSSGDDDSLDDLDFNIYFALTNDFEDLNDDWDILSQSSVKIELVDISGGSGETDYLTFEKN